MLQNILDAFGLNADDVVVAPFGSGLINNTWRVTAGDDQYILQRINTNIFRSPQAIADNLALLKEYLERTAPGYLFVAPLPSVEGRYLVVENDKYYRLFPFIKDSHTVDVVTEPAQAYEAAKQFGKFSRLLNELDAGKLQYTLPDFHNLNLRVDQYRAALAKADADRLKSADIEIKEIERYSAIADTYRQLVAGEKIPLRVIHHDTKINNVLFDTDNKGFCVIDLDTVMPGYYISDVGDMMRTYLSPANEEERGLSKISIREENFIAVRKGYLAEMGEVLTPAEKSLFFYSGEFMIYMQALRFLTDHLNGDSYYHTNYPGHNLHRAQNQLALLNAYVALKDKFKDLPDQI